MTTTKKSFNGFQMPANSDEWKQEALLAYASAIDSAHPLNKDQQAIRNEAGKQLLIIKYESVKVAAVQEEMGKVHKHAAGSFETVVKHHFDLQAAAQGKEYQGVLEKFHEYDLNTCAKHYEQAMEVGFYNIMQTMSDRIKPPVEPDVITVVKERPPRGLLERLFGGDE